MHNAVFGVIAELVLFVSACSHPQGVLRSISDVVQGVLFRAHHG